MVWFPEQNADIPLSHDGYRPAPSARIELATPGLGNRIPPIRCIGRQSIQGTERRMAGRLQPLSLMFFYPFYQPCWWGLWVVGWCTVLAQFCVGDVHSVCTVDGRGIGRRGRRGRRGRSMWARLTTSPTTLTSSASRVGPSAATPEDDRGATRDVDQKRKR